MVFWVWGQGRSLTPQGRNTPAVTFGLVKLDDFCWKGHIVGTRYCSGLRPRSLWPSWYRCLSGCERYLGGRKNLRWPTRSTVPHGSPVLRSQLWNGKCLTSWVTSGHPSWPTSPTSSWSSWGSSAPFSTGHATSWW